MQKVVEWSQMRTGFLSLVLLFVILQVLGTTTCANEVQVNYCAGCGQVITSDYVSIQGKLFHPWCFVCAGCGEVIAGDFFEHEGNFFHPNCYRDRFSPRCAYCGLPVSGRYIEKNDSLYHEQCYIEHIAPRCIVSNEPLIGPYVEDYWGNCVHPRFRDVVDRCHSCGRFLKSTDGFRLSDGRRQCQVCRSTEVTALREVREIVLQARDWLEQAGIRFSISLGEIELDLVTIHDLEQMSDGNGDPHGMHVVQVRKSLFGRVSEESTIHLLDHLPADLLLGVAAHELFHVWQHEKHADGGSMAWREGSANVAAWIVLSRIDSDLAHYQLQSLQETQDPNYGDGFRTALKYLEQHGMEKYLEKVSTECGGR